MARVNFTGRTDKVISGYKRTRLEVKGLLIVPTHRPLQQRNSDSACFSDRRPSVRSDVTAQTDRYGMRPLAALNIAQALNLSFQAKLLCQSMIYNTRAA